MRAHIRRVRAPCAYMRARLRRCAQGTIYFLIFKCATLRAYLRIYTHMRASCAYHAHTMRASYTHHTRTLHALCAHVARTMREYARTCVNSHAPSNICAVTCAHSSRICSCHTGTCAHPVRIFVHLCECMYILGEHARTLREYAHSLRKNVHSFANLCTLCMNMQAT